MKKHLETYVSGKVYRLSKQVFLIILKLNFNSIQISKSLIISVLLKEHLKC